MSTYIYGLFVSFFLFGMTAPQLAMASSFTRFLDHTQRRIAVGWTPLDEWSAHCRDLYLTTHNTHNKRPCPPVGIEPTVSASMWPLTYTSDRAASGTSTYIYCTQQYYVNHIHLTLYLLMWRIWWAPNNASEGRMGFNLAFKGLMLLLFPDLLHGHLMYFPQLTSKL